jgi:hypothetical protein
MVKKKQFINNADFHNALTIYKNELNNSIDNNLDAPKISEYIGQSIILICNNLAKRPNFSGYSYKQEMISDAILMSLAAVNNFDPARSSNPFGYFTQIAWNAFVLRIQKEKKQNYIKHKNMQNIMMFEAPTGEIDNELSSKVIEEFEKTFT